MNIIRTNEKIKIEKCEKSPNKKLILTEDEENLKLGKIDIKDSKYYFTPVTKSTNVLNENGSNSNGTKVFKIKKLDDNYMIYFVNKYGDEEELGELIMKPEV